MRELSAMTSGKTTARRVRERKRIKGGRETHCTRTSGPVDEQGWEAGVPPPEPDAWWCKQLPCASDEEVMWSSRARVMAGRTCIQCIHG